MVCWKSKGQKMAFNVHVSIKLCNVTCACLVAYEIWDALSKTLYDREGLLRKAKWKKKLYILWRVNIIFQELDHRDKVVMKDPDDVKAYCRSIEWLRVHIFLDGLNEGFDQIRREILHRDPILNLEECYSLIWWEAIRSTTLKGDSLTLEASAMVARNWSNQNQQDLLQANNDKTINGIDKCWAVNRIGELFSYYGSFLFL